MDRSCARLAVGLLVTLIALGGCATAGPSAPPDSKGSSPSAGTSAGLPGTSWIVLTVGGSDTVADHRPTMAFGGDGQVQGTGGCNGYGGPYTVDGDAIEVGELASTLILCEGDVGTQEAAFMAALNGARRGGSPATVISNSAERQTSSPRRKGRRPRAARAPASSAAGTSPRWVRRPTSRICCRRSNSERTAPCQDSRDATPSTALTRAMARRSRSAPWRLPRSAARGRRVRSRRSTWKHCPG